MRPFSRKLFSTVGFVALVLSLDAGESERSDGMVLQSLRQARFRFEGVLGERINANVENWLLPAPRANPGMLEMFRLRDRRPAPNLVPWAGEFVGKYLISAIQGIHLTDRLEVEAVAHAVVEELIASQADDGYLGPFPKTDRLKGNWDLWGHYHAILALLEWYELKQDPAALAACRRAADLVCRTFLDSGLRVFDAGSHEMNMAIIHALGRLYRLTRETNYLRMMREIEKDWERAGDYQRAGLDGREFFQSPRPRWESLHDLQGLIELYLITGQTSYRDAFEHHWRSIVRWDRRNSGGFSSGEQATGNPYAPTAIETCCTVAWMAISLDMLRMTGDAAVAGELELATFNAAIGAQHPSGRWWTYNTPMDGAREASAHTIVFQARAGTPELNCCSVNGPRSLGMLADWTLMTSNRALVVNSYAPGSFSGRLADDTPVNLRVSGDYPIGGNVRLEIQAPANTPFTLLLRIPSWSARTKVKHNDNAIENVIPGAYLPLKSCGSGDCISLDMDMELRHAAGAREATGRVSVYRGPLLLAYDQRFNKSDEEALPALDLSRFSEARILAPTPKSAVADPGSRAPWLLVEVPAESNSTIALCDFASAGAMGTRYRSWLRASDCPPPPVVTRLPADGATVPAGRVLMRWTGPTRPAEGDPEYRLVIAEEPGFRKAVVDRGSIEQTRFVLEETDSKALVPSRWYYWKVISRDARGLTDNTPFPARFRVNPGLPPVAAAVIERFFASPPEIVAAARLRGDVEPSHGALISTTAVKGVVGPDGSANGAIELDGVKDRVLYAVDEWPEDDYSISILASITALPEGHLGQVLSGWATGMDDPLRVCVDQGKLFARIEAGQGYSSQGVAIAPGQWLHIAAVKKGAGLTLFVNGEPRSTVVVPETIHTSARDFALGGNPHYGGNEFLAVRFAEFALYGRALDPGEVRRLAQVVTK